MSTYVTVRVLFLTISSLRYSTRRYLEKRTWKQRLTRARQNWEPVLPSLVKLYMGWKYTSTTISPVSPMTANPPHPTPDIPAPSVLSFSLQALDIYTLEDSVTISYSDEDLLIQALVKSGYLGNSPATPSLAISLQTLELFRHIRLRKPSFSVEAFTKVICDMYSVSPCPTDTH